MRKCVHTYTRAYYTHNQVTRRCIYGHMMNIIYVLVVIFNKMAVPLGGQSPRVYITHAEAEEQGSSSGILSTSFETGSLIGLQLTIYARRTGQGTPGILLCSLCLQVLGLEVHNTTARNF